MVTLGQHLKNINARINSFAHFDQEGEITLILRDMLSVMRTLVGHLTHEIQDMETFRNETLTILNDKIKKLEKEARKRGKEKR